MVLATTRALRRIVGTRPHPPASAPLSTTTRRGAQSLTMAPKRARAVTTVASASEAQQKTAQRPKQQASSISNGAGHEENPAATKLARLRALLRERGLSAYLVPTDDPHLCEMPPESFRRREWITGFTGSAGTAIVVDPACLDLAEADGAALLWTDGRYFLQAERELDGTPWTLMRSGMPDVLEPAKWLRAHLPPGSRVGFDPMVHTVSAVRALHDALSDPADLPTSDANPDGATQAPMRGLEVVAVSGGNLVDAVWDAVSSDDVDAGVGPLRPPPPSAPLRVHPPEYAGATVCAKLAKLRKSMMGKATGGGGAGRVLVLCTLDEVAWLLNVRGGDVPNSPVTMAYVLVTAEPKPEKEAEKEGEGEGGVGGRCVLYVDPSKLGASEGPVQSHLREAGVEVRPYESVTADLAAMCREQGLSVCLDPALCNYGLYEVAFNAHIEGGGDAGAKSNGDTHAASSPSPSSSGEEGEGMDASLAMYASSDLIHEKKSPVAAAKAVKNEAELAGFVEAHRRDGAALASFFHWLEQEVGSHHKQPTEYEISEQLEGFRAKQRGFFEPSFPTIAGEGCNGAIIHYRPEEGTCRRITQDSMLLLDSGGQYDCGTTDVTRTVHFGTPTAHQQECFTRVLKGHIALASLVFPEHTPGFMVDAFARQSLWRAGLDYRHGTGHGVGAALNVHEGPQGISSRFNNTTGLKRGMVVSNEPGYYEEGDEGFGVRIENLVSLVEANTAHRFGDKTFLGMFDLTLVPIQRKLIVASMLTEEERGWLDAYHARVWEEIAPRVEGSTKEWLREHTRPLL